MDDLKFLRWITRDVDVFGRFCGNGDSSNGTDQCSRLQLDPREVGTCNCIAVPSAARMAPLAGIMTTWLARAKLVLCDPGVKRGARVSKSRQRESKRETTLRLARCGTLAHEAMHAEGADAAGDTAHVCTVWSESHVTRGELLRPLFSLAYSHTQIGRASVKDERVSGPPWMTKIPDPIPRCFLRKCQRRART